MKNMGNKIIKTQDIVGIRNELKKNEKKIVFSNGYYDPLHIGHMKQFREAKKLGDVLIVGINSDSSVRANKGMNRPYMNEDERAEIVSSLSFVDYVVIFSELTPINILNMLQPDILVKGNNYSLNEVVGKDIVESHGGKVVLLPMVDGMSSDKILDSMGLK